VEKATFNWSELMCTSMKQQGGDMFLGLSLLTW